MPKISIIIPAYNVEEYIYECLDSILNQTFTDYEVIVVDDCSTDNTYSIIESYIPKFNNKLTLLKTDKNSGTCSIPRNMGLPYTKGDYIWFIDSDDYIALNALELINDIITKNDVDMVYFPQYYRVSYNIIKKLWNDNVYDPNRINKVTKTEQIVTQEDMLKSFVFPGTNVMVMLYCIKKDIVFNNKMLFLPILHQDHIWTLTCYLHINNCYCCQTPIYYYNQRNGSIMHKIDDEKTYVYEMLKTILMTCQRFEQLQKNYPILQTPFYYDCFINRLYRNKKRMYKRLTGSLLPENLVNEIVNTQIKDPALIEIFNRKWKTIEENCNTLSKYVIEQHT